MIEMNNKGSFLVEIILLLAFIAIILNIAILDMDIVYKLNLNRETAEFKRDIDDLRINSLKNGARSYLFLDVEGNSYRLSLKDKNGSGYKNKKTVYPKYFKIVSNNPDYSFIQTGAVSKGGTIELHHRYGIWKISISPVTGKTSLKK